MKSINQLLKRSAWIVGLAWAVSVSAQQDLIINLFDAADEATQWARWWGVNEQTYEFDATMDADGNTNSGSLKVIIQFDYATYGGDNQFSALKNLESPVNGLDYTNLVMDIYMDPTSAQRPGGDFGYLEYGIRHSDYSQDYFGALVVPVTNDWIHLEARVPWENPGIDDMAGITFKMWSGSEGSAQNGDFIMWVDNIKLIASGGEPPPPPDLAISKAIPGLNLIASAPGNQWQRQSIRTVANNLSWVEHPFDQVSYYIGVRDYPDQNHAGFQTHLFLVPEIDLPYGPDDTSIDWNAPNVVFVHIANNTNGTAVGRFMYKTNQPSGNSMLWNAYATNGPVGTLAMLPSDQPEGIWGVTFDGLDNSITLFEPGGTSTNFPMLSAEASTLFANPLYAYVGVQPNNTNNIGQNVALEFISFQSQDPSFPFIEDAFSGDDLDTATWSVVAADPAGVTVVPLNGVYWISWSLPAIGFTLQTSPSLDTPTWTDVIPTKEVQRGSSKFGLITTPLLPTTTQGYFQMTQPPQ